MNAPYAMTLISVDSAKAQTMTKLDECRWTNGAKKMPQSDSIARNDSPVQMAQATTARMNPIALGSKRLIEIKLWTFLNR
ncbi:hypothetical protein MASR2M48_19090 [Spirochaetota bacterium]|jgi:hypothetical protein